MAGAEALVASHNERVRKVRDWLEKEVKLVLKDMQKLDQVFIYWSTSPYLLVHITSFIGLHHLIYGSTSPHLLVHITSFIGPHHLIYWSTSHCNENPIYVFLFWELRGLSPNVRVHVSGERFIYFQNRFTYFPAAELADRSWDYINRAQTQE